LDDVLVIADASLIAAGFQQLRLSHAGAPFSAQAHVPVRPGAWHVFVAGPAFGAPQLLFLAHHDELDEPFEAPEASVFERVMVPTQRVVLAHPALGSDPATCQALGAVDSEQLPGMILHIGAMATVSGGPIIAMSSATTAPYTSVVVPLAGP
jgi:hypothetical protein